MKGFKYNTYKYIFPPRPKNAIPKDSIVDYDSIGFVSQPKLNGSNVVISTNGIDSYVMNRHGGRLTRFQLTKEEILSLHRGKIGEWMVINGEYMNKSKKDKDNNTFNHKLVIFDILVYESVYLVGESFKYRIELLDNLYGKEDSEDKFLYSIDDNVFRVKSYIGGSDLTFEELFEELILIDMYEGLVIKRKRAKLETGRTELNNHNSQVKSRKKTKNYNF